MVAGGGVDGGGSRRLSINTSSRRSEAEEVHDVEVLDGGRWVDAGVYRASVVVINIDDNSSDSTHSSPSSTNPSPIDYCDGKRKMAFSSKVPAKKRHHTNKKVFSCPNDSVGNSSSNLTGDEVTRLFKTANMSSTDYEFLVPSKDQRANEPPEGYISVYAEQIAAGLRFPLHDLVVRVCNLIEVSPSQLVPNAHRMIVGFILCAKLYDIPLTGGSFFGLFAVHPGRITGLFQFAPFNNKKFLTDETSNGGPWKRKFFFLRPKGKSWNCLTKWSQKFSKPQFDAVLAELAVEKGITDHHFRVNELICKEILVHGGIEPGVPSPEFTFRYLMHRVAVTKFELLPEDLPPARATIGRAKTPSTGPLSAPSNLDTSTAGAASPAQLGAKQPVNRQQTLLSPSHTKIPPSTEFPISKDLSASSEEDYQKLEKQELASELVYTKSRIQELGQELELAEAKRADSENRSSWAIEATKILEKRLENPKLESDKIRDKVAKDAIEEFKSSDEFLNSVQDEAATYYIDGFETCRLQFLNLGKLPKGFDFDFLDVSANEWGKSSGPVDEKFSKPQT